MVHFDAGEYNILSLGGSKYYVTFIDEASNYVRAGAMKKKGQSSEKLDKHIAWIERKTWRNVVRIAIDGSG